MNKQLGITEKVIWNIYGSHKSPFWILKVPSLQKFEYNFIFQSKSIQQENFHYKSQFSDPLSLTHKLKLQSV